MQRHPPSPAEGPQPALLHNDQLANERLATLARTQCKSVRATVLPHYMLSLSRKHVPRHVVATPELLPGCIIRCSRETNLACVTHSRVSLGKSTDSDRALLAQSRPHSPMPLGVTKRAWGEHQAIWLWSFDGWLGGDTRPVDVAEAVASCLHRRL